MVVDDDVSILRMLGAYFTRCGFQVSTATRIDEAKRVFQREKSWTLVVSDYHLPDGSGWDFCCWVRARSEVTPPFLLMSGGFNGKSLAGVEFLAKPFDLSELDARVKAMLDPRAAEPSSLSPA